MKFTQHFEEMIKERLIQQSWIEQTLNKPETVKDKPDGTRHFFRRIPENGNRWLHIVVNIKTKPFKAITVFFDRGMKGK